MYARYLKEALNQEMLETPNGFLTYGFNCVPGVTVPHVYCIDLYVIPEMRRSRVGTEMTDEVVRRAKEKGCQLMFGSINTKNSNPDASLKALQSYGMKLFSAAENAIWLFKEI